MRRSRLPELLATALVLQNRLVALRGEPPAERDVRRTFRLFEYLRVRAYARHIVARAYEVTADADPDPALREVAGALAKTLEADAPTGPTTLSGALEAWRAFTERVPEMPLERMASQLEDCLRAKPLHPFALTYDELRGLDDLLMRRASIRLVWNEGSALYGEFWQSPGHVDGLTLDFVGGLARRVQEFDMRVRSALRGQVSPDQEGAGPDLSIRNEDAFEQHRRGLFEQHFPLHPVRRAAGDVLPVFSHHILIVGDLPLGRAVSNQRLF